MGITMKTKTKQKPVAGVNEWDNLIQDVIDLNDVATTKDANSNVGAVKATSISIGISGSEVAVTATPSELNLNDVSAQTETIVKGGTVSVVKKNTKINSTTGTGAITLAAPDASMYGVVKTIEMITDGGDITLSLANVKGGTAATTATFSAVDQMLVLVGMTNYWGVIGEVGVVLS